MDILSYFECIIFVMLSSQEYIINKTKIKDYIWIIIWRIETIIYLFDLIFSLYFGRLMHSYYFILLSLFMCLLIIPLSSQISICSSCGKRVYWQPLISNSCQHCDGKIAK
jgi:hypothetical protein